jgi:hypothetical protein
VGCFFSVKTGQQVGKAAARSRSMRTTTTEATMATKHCFKWIFLLLLYLKPFTASPALCDS